MRPTHTSEVQTFMKASHKIAGFLAGMVLLVALGIASVFWAFRQLEVATETRSHSERALSSANALLSELKDAETGQRGYVITGDKTFLGPYLSARNSIGAHLEELRQLSHTPAARDHVAAMSPMIDSKMAELKRVIEMGDKQSAAVVAAAISGGDGKRTMDSIRAEMSSYVLEEETALALHEASFHSEMRLLFTGIAVGSMLILILALSFAFLLYREMQNRLKDLVHLETRQLLEAQKETSERLQQANASLQSSEDKLAVTLHSIGDGLIATDAAGCVTLMNPIAQQLTGWTQAEAL